VKIRREKIANIDPRIKILLVLMFSALVFAVDKLPVAAGLMLLFFGFRLLAGIPFHGIRSFVPLFVLAAFMVLLQMLFGPGENFLIKPLFPQWLPFLGGRGSLKRDGFYSGLAIGCRLAALTNLLPIITETTSPRRIAEGLTGLGLNYCAAFIITTTFNLIPFFEEEGRAIMDAQKMRGIRSRGIRSFREGSVFGRLKAYPGLVIPLVLGAMRKARTAGIAMDSRAFGVYKTRTWSEKPSMKTRDYLFIAGGTAIAALALWLNHLLKQG
jgi:energy-coupling factor transport system permease protein